MRKVQLKSELFLHAMLLLNGCFEMNDGYTQCIPSFKEMMAWEQPVVENMTIYRINAGEA